SLLGADRLLAPAREPLRDVPADEADIYVHRRRAAITRYSRSSIHQNAVSDETHATVRAIVGKAVGIVTTNSLAPPDLRRALAYLRALVQSDTYVGSGYAEELSMRSDALHPKTIAARAAEKCSLDRDRAQLEPGDYEAVFEELAVAEVLRIMSLTGLGGQTVR